MCHQYYRGLLQDVFNDIALDDDEDYEIDQVSKEYVRKGGKIIGELVSFCLVWFANDIYNIERSFTGQDKEGKKKEQKKEEEKEEEEDSGNASDTEESLLPAEDSDDEGIPESHDVDSDDLDSDDTDSDDTDSDDNDSDAGVRPVTAQIQTLSTKSQKAKDGFEIVSQSKPVKLDPLEMAIGEELIKSRKRRREIIEMSYNRYDLRKFWQYSLPKT